MGRRRRPPETPSLRYQWFCMLEAGARLARIVGIVAVALLVLGSPAIYLYEYDQQNEPSPKLTPDDLYGYATWGVPLIVGLLVMGFLGPWIRRRKIELTPGIAGIDQMQQSSSRDQKLLGATDLAPRKDYDRAVGERLEGPGANSPGDFGKIVQHRSTQGRRLGIVYRGDEKPAPTLRRKKSSHQRKRGPKKGLWHSLRRALGFSRKGRNRPSWWRAWLRIS
jgi:hypothetical protein